MTVNNVNLGGGDTVHNVRKRKLIKSRKQTKAIDEN